MCLALALALAQPCSCSFAFNACRSTSPPRRVPQHLPTLEHQHLAYQPRCAPPFPRATHTTCTSRAYQPSPLCTTFDTIFCLSSPSCMLRFFGLASRDSKSSTEMPPGKSKFTMLRVCARLHCPPATTRQRMHPWRGMRQPRYRGRHLRRPAQLYLLDALLTRHLCMNSH